MRVLGGSAVAGRTPAGWTVAAAGIGKDQGDEEEKGHNLHYDIGLFIK